MGKRGLTVALAVLLIVATLLTSFGCSSPKKDERLQIVCSVFPVYDWVRRVTADLEEIEVTLLIQNGTDAHSYQPSAEDLVRIASCDLLVYVGGVSEAWIAQTAQKHPSDERREVSLVDLQGITLREISAESHEAHDHDHDHETGEADEHLWLSLQNARVAVEAIAEALREMTESEETRERLEENAEKYCAELASLDGEFRSLAAEYPKARVLFADRFPFVYLFEEYGIDYVAAFRGCSTDAEADFDTILRLARVIDEDELAWIVVTETSDASLAQSVRRATQKQNQSIAVMHSLQALTLADAQNGVSYQGVMEENLRTLRIVLENKLKS